MAKLQLLIKKELFVKLLFIKEMSWILSTADDSAFNVLKRLEIHMASKEDPIPIYVENSTQVKEVLDEIYKYK